MAPSSHWYHSGAGRFVPGIRCSVIYHHLITVNLVIGIKWTSAIAAASEYEHVIIYACCRMKVTPFGRRALKLQENKVILL